MTVFHTPEQLGTHTCAYHGCTEDTRRYHTTTDGYRIGYCKLHQQIAEHLFDRPGKSDNELLAALVIARTKQANS